MKTFILLAAMALTNLAEAVECIFQIAPVNYTVEINHAVSALVFYGQPGASGDGYELKYEGTGLGGAAIYSSARAKLFVSNANGMLSLKLLDLGLGEVLFQNQQCHNSAEIDPRAVAANVEAAIPRHTEIATIIRAIEQARGIKCTLDRGMTKVESKEVRNEDYGNTTIETSFASSLSCQDLTYNAYAGAILLSGYFANNGTDLTLEQVKINRGGN